MKIVRNILTAGVFLLSCSTDNLLDAQADLTPEQEARALMNDGKYQEAIDILQPLVTAEPEQYGRMPLLSAAYADLAGVSLLGILDAQLSASGGDSVFDQLDGFLPSSYGSSEIATMSTSVEQLEAIPSSERGATGDPDYGASAELQLLIYRAVYATMFLNQFVTVIDGNIDPNALSEMTAADAAEILGALRAAAADGGEGSEAVNETLAEIDASPGATDEEKLENYMASQD